MYKFDERIAFIGKVILSHYTHGQKNLPKPVIVSLQFDTKTIL
jgi:hypothetical protein